MDGLELSVGERGVEENGQIVAGEELDEVLHRCGIVLRLRRDMEGPQRTEPAAAHPHQLPAEAAGVHRAFQELFVHGEDRLEIELGGQAQRCLHHAHVRHDRTGVAAA